MNSAAGNSDNADRIHPWPVPPDPSDRLGPWALGWLAWTLAFAALEGAAIYRDSRSHDRVKRTLSANLRYVFATDSVTGVPLAVPYGRARRFLLGVAIGPPWLPNHLGRKGVV